MNKFSKIRIIGKYIKYLYYNITHKKVIHCIGDSHVGVFNYYRNNAIFKNTVFKVYSISGATAMGITNLNSSTNARKFINDYLRITHKTHTLLFSFGEVDCDFAIWLKAKKQNTSIAYQFRTAIKRYKEFLVEIQNIGYKNIIIYSVPLPTIKKNQSGGLVSELRKNANISIRKRTDLTIKFNRLMKRYCIRRKIIFFDMTSILINKKTNIIDNKFINPNRLDHHIYDRAIIPYITDKLKIYGFS